MACRRWGEEHAEAVPWRPGVVLAHDLLHQSLWQRARAVAVALPVAAVPPLAAPSL